jgi:hypothetical protein
MNKFTSRSMATALLASIVVLAASPTVAADTASAGVQVVGQKLDSGLGDLPHYSQWADPTGSTPLRRASGATGVKVQVAGEKKDSGLGDLPHFSQWADTTGRQQAVQVSLAK